MLLIWHERRTKTEKANNVTILPNPVSKMLISPVVSLIMKILQMTMIVEKQTTIRIVEKMASTFEMMSCNFMWTFATFSIVSVCLSFTLSLLSITCFK